MVDWYKEQKSNVQFAKDNNSAILTGSPKAETQENTSIENPRLIQQTTVSNKKAPE